MLRIEEQEGNCRAFIEGEMTIYNAAELKDKLQPLLDTGCDVEVNLADVTEIDTAGIQLLMMIKKERSGKKLGFSLIEHSDTVLDVFELMDLVSFFNDAVVLPGDKGEQHGS